MIVVEVWKELLLLDKEKRKKSLRRCHPSELKLEDSDMCTQQISSNADIYVRDRGENINFFGSVCVGEFESNTTCFRLSTTNTHVTFITLQNDPP